MHFIGAIVILECNASWTVFHAEYKVTYLLTYALACVDVC